MKRVFAINDIVYHPKYGKGVVEGVDSHIHAECPYLVEYEKDYYPGWVEESMLSFEPWPKTVHVRPFKKGWYVFKNPRGQVGCRDFFDAPPTSYKMLVYLGEHLPEEMK